MEIQEIPVGKIRRDPTQPRTYFDPVLVAELAQSIKTEGVINPVEVDKNLVIVTGEIRWRAAKVAGIKTIPCKIINIDAKTRFRRQVIENMHHNTMTDTDTAMAIKRLLDEQYPDAHKHKGGYPDKGIRELARKLGKAHSFIAEKLALLEASVRFRRAVSRGLSATFLRAIKAAPEEYREAMEKKIVGKGFQTRDGAKYAAQAIKFAPDKVKPLLEKDYSEMNSKQVIMTVNKIVPDFSETPLAKGLELALHPSEEIAAAIRKLRLLLDQYQIEDIGLFNLPRIIASMDVLNQKIIAWMKRQPEPEMEHPTKAEERKFYNKMLETKKLT